MVHSREKNAKQSDSDTEAKDISKKVLVCKFGHARPNGGQ